MTRINIRQVVIISSLMLVSVLLAYKLISSNFILLPSVLAGGGGKSESNSYKIESGVLGSGVFGYAESASVKNDSGYIPQLEQLANPPTMDLSEAYVYPNPFKPNSPDSRYYSDKITFKKLPAEAKIKVYNIAGELVATIHKINPSVDYYEWDATNDRGEKLGSGVYIYYITNLADSSQNIKGRFVIVR
ncbi:MAG: gliding motility-associated C-terminal domain-containing protein [Endomicrobia bacterium]|nr:gliding motility-associated C-terminal domain-containing protein [Endomicrobiia bacterium]